MILDQEFEEDFLRVSHFSLREALPVPWILRLSGDLPGGDRPESGIGREKEAPRCESLLGIQWLSDFMQQHFDDWPNYNKSESNWPNELGMNDSQHRDA